jgi:AraC-like DNA-binding protein
LQKIGVSCSAQTPLPGIAVSFDDQHLLVDSSASPQSPSFEPARGTIRTHSMPIQGAIELHVRALIALDLDGTGPLPLAIAPHESMVLSVQLGRGGHSIEEKGGHGELTHFTGIREWTGHFTGAGDCTTLLALLTPLGAMQLLGSQPLQATPRIRARADSLLDRRLVHELESGIALANTLHDKLHAFAAWLESRAVAKRRVERSALRAGCAAMRLCAAPALPIEALAAEQHVSRRQLERDFERWIATSPRHLARVARVQAVSRQAQAGAALADIAADVGFADQAHMSRVVQQITGLTPRRFVRRPPTPLASVFRQATAGGTVYL